MASEHSPLDDIRGIRELMDRNSRYLSLSGLSGVSAGIIALVGAWLARPYLSGADVYKASIGFRYISLTHMRFLVADATVVLVLSVAAAFFFSWRLARQRGQTMVFNRSAKRMLMALAQPLVVGGFFCIGLIYHLLVFLLMPATLVFYGLALLATEPFTLREIRTLGYAMCLLGLASIVFPAYGIYFWAFGFGVLHILYGTVMYLRYERNDTGGNQ